MKDDMLFTQMCNEEQLTRLRDPDGSKHFCCTLLLCMLVK